MILSISSRISCLVLVLGLTAQGAEKLDLEKAVGSLVEAERAYARQGVEKGFRAASLANFSEEAVIFAPDLTNGKKFWTEAKEDPVIDWAPSFAAIARSGELGYTTGPAVYLENRNDPTPVGYGHFVSIWQRNPEGTWKVMVDIGVNHTQPSEPLAAAKTSVPKSPLAHPESAAADFEKAKIAFSEDLRMVEGPAILAAASDDVRVYRRGSIPLVGKTAAKGLLDSERGKTSRIRSGGGISKAGDLAYEYGEYTSDQEGGRERGIYLCIWQIDSDNNWKLVVDLQKKAPAPKQ
jgi:ketosteroid isomerase-like protein